MSLYADWTMHVSYDHLFIELTTHDFRQSLTFTHDVQIITYACRSDYRTASERNVTVICLISSYTDSFTSIFDDMHTAYVKYHFYASLLVNSVAILWCHMWFRLLRIYNLSNGEKVLIKLVTFYIRSGGSRQQTQFT